MGQYHPQQPLLIRSKEGHRTRWVKGQVQGWSGSHQGFNLSQRVGRVWLLSQRPELDVVGFTLGCHELDPIFLVFLQLWSVCWDMLSKSLHLIILWSDILEVEFIKVILLKWLGFYPSQSLLQITVSIFEGVQGRHNALSEVGSSGALIRHLCLEGCMLVYNTSLLVRDYTLILQDKIM